MLQNSLWNGWRSLFSLCRTGYRKSARQHPPLFDVIGNSCYALLDSDEKFIELHFYHVDVGAVVAIPSSETVGKVFFFWRTIMVRQGSPRIVFRWHQE